MAIDAPLIVYSHEKYKRKKGEPREFDKAKGSDVLQARLDWEKKYSNKEKDSPIAFDLSKFSFK